MKKSVSFKSPTRPADPADSWVASRAADTELPASAVLPEPLAAPEPTEPMKRFTIDVPVSLHRRVKMGCADRGVKMTDIMRDLLEREFPAKS